MLIKVYFRHRLASKPLRFQKSTYNRAYKDIYVKITNFKDNDYFVHVDVIEQFNPSYSEDENSKQRSDMDVQV